MIDTLTVIAYLLGHDAGSAGHLQLKAFFPEKQTTQCVQKAVSPQLQWRGVPPEADSLAVVVHDKKNYYWVAYNLPAYATILPFGANKIINKYDEGVNSFGERNYHSPWVCGQNVKDVVVELYALDNRISTKKPLSPEGLFTKIKNHVLAKTQVVLAS